MVSLVQIVPGELSDHEWCAQLMASNDPWITLKRDLNECRSALLRPETELFIAKEAAGQPRGFILVAPHGFAGSPYIASIAVAPDAQEQGIGAQMLAFTEQHFRDRRHLFLLVSSFNQRAQQFYCRHGFLPVGELKDYIVPGHSELIFHKRIP